MAATLLPQLSAACHSQIWVKLKDDCVLKVCSWLLSGCGPHRPLRGSEGLAHINHPQLVRLRSGNHWQLMGREAAQLRADTNTDRASEEKQHLKLLCSDNSVKGTLKNFPQSLVYGVSKEGSFSMSQRTGNERAWRVISAFSWVLHTS